MRTAERARLARASRLRRPTAIVVGRDDELRRVEAALDTIPVAVIYGVAGVGKSTLALEHASRWSGPVVYLKLGGEMTVAAIAHEVHRQLGVTRFDVSLTDEERLEDIWALLDDHGCLAVIDDIHHLPAEARDLVVDSATQFLHRGRLVAVSRELIPVAAGAPDRLQLRLEALDRSSARLLWERLIELYGPGRDFETAWQRSHGNPFLLRQGHAGTLVDSHPLESVARSLGADDQRLAGALALSRTPLPRCVLLRLLPAPRGERSLAELVTRLIADVTPDDHLVMHDLLRETILRTLDAVTSRAIAADLVDALAGSSLDVFTRVQETARHLRFLGRHAEIGTLLLANSAELVRQGADAALLSELDALPPSAITLDLLVLRLRTLARAMQIRRAYLELGRLIDRGGASPQMRFFLATFATVCGELEHAGAVLEALFVDPDLDPDLRIQVKQGLAWTLADRGDPAAARRILADPELAAPRPRSRCLALQMQLHLHELDDERAADLAADVLLEMRSAPVDLWSSMITPVICAAALARAGRFDEADGAIAGMERGLHNPEACLELQWTKVMVAFERGERLRPLAYFLGMQRVLDRGGHFVGSVWTRVLCGKILFALGRRAQALAVLAEVDRQCETQHAAAFRSMIRAAALDDPASPDWLTREPCGRPTKLGEVVRDRVRSALRVAATCGWRDVAGGLPRPDIPPDADYAFDRALLELAHAVLARRRGQKRVAAQHLGRAVAKAASSGADDGLIAMLYEAWSGAAAEPSVAEPVAEDTLVIDGEHHEIHVGKHRVSLGSRAVLRRLIYAFACSPDHHLSRDVIARVLWDAAYDPLRHESSLKSNIRRLRELLTGTGAALQSESDGYRMHLPRGAVVIPPA